MTKIETFSRARARVGTFRDIRPSASVARLGVMLWGKRRQRHVCSDEEIEKLENDAAAHALRIVGLAAIGNPHPNEPLKKAIDRVVEIVGREPDIALRIAGVAALKAAGGAEALPRILNALPAWLDAFAYTNATRLLLKFDLRSHSETPISTRALRDSLRAWPELPASAYGAGA